MLRNVRLAIAAPGLAAILLAGFGLSACDDQGTPDATSLTEPHSSSDGAHWQKVCSREYFYRFSGAKPGEDAYCAEWQNKCVDGNGDPADGCES